MEALYFVIFVIIVLFLLYLANQYYISDNKAKEENLYVTIDNSEYQHDSQQPEKKQVRWNPKVMVFGYLKNKPIIS